MTDFRPLFTQARGPERIAKRMARAGLCSRRDAERWIAAGRVAVDGELLTTPAITVDEKSRITVDGTDIPTIEPPRLWRYHKPRGLVTTNRDPEGRPTVFEQLPEDMPRVVTVGRLDMDSEGLMLMTNDGELARLLELPSTGWVRRYRVRVYGRVNEKDLKALERGVTVDGISYGSISATIDAQAASNAWLTIGLREGKYREVRKVMEHLQLPVNRLIRISYGPFQLGEMPAGETEEVRPRALREQLGTLDKSSGEPAKPKERTKPKLPRGRKPSSGSGNTGPSRPKLSLKPQEGNSRDEKSRDRTRSSGTSASGRPTREKPARGKAGDKPARGKAGDKPARGKAGDKPGAKSGGRGNADRRRSGPRN
jgi:23S rRNA pseudouridine2605 synthase